MYSAHEIRQILGEYLFFIGITYFLGKQYWGVLFPGVLFDGYTGLLSEKLLFCLPNSN